MESLHADMWDGEAYTAQISVHRSLLAQAPGLVVQMEDGTMPPVCTVERHKKAVIFQDTHLSGPCAYAEFHLQGGFNIVIYKPYPKGLCCLLGITLLHSRVTQGVLLWDTLDKYGVSEKSVHVSPWKTSGLSISTELHILCIEHCLGAFIHIHTNHNSTHKTTVAYRASLIENDYTLYQSEAEYSILSRHWGQVCLKHTCYTWPSSPNITTWNDAREECERKNTSLLSINTDFEFSLVDLLMPDLSHYIGTYIGLNVKVSKETPDLTKPYVLQITVYNCK